VRYIDSPQALSSADWFELDRVTFQTGSNSLTAGSADQVSNIAAIMDAFPTLRLKIGGYTDNAGDPAANLRLSDARANTVMRELIRIGVASERLTAEGYGELHPVADNNTAEGRARNRRIAFRVTQR
jgi:outer membrane protein OmpA-like peptidoglycan-associated protein